MSYNPITDFLGLLRSTPGGVRQASIPGLDYVLSALARAGLITLYAGQVAPTANQATTVWLKPASPSWSAEGVLYLWDAATAAYEIATPALWQALFTAPSSGAAFQTLSVDGAVNVSTGILAIEKIAPATTTLTLPSVALRANRQPLRIVDWSTNVVNHAISLVQNGSDTIMKAALWKVYSTPDQVGGIELTPVVELGAWIITP